MAAKTAKKANTTASVKKAESQSTKKAEENESVTESNVEESKDNKKEESKESTSSVEKKLDSVSGAMESVANAMNNLANANSKEPEGFKARDLITCRSITTGQLILTGDRSKTKYTWDNHGDITEVEVQDLEMLKGSHSAYLYRPLFIVENDEFMEQPRWKDLKEQYEQIKYDDIVEILKLRNDAFERAMNDIPDGYKEAVMSEASSQILDGTFDSIQKVKIIDKICGSDLFSLLS